MKHIKTLVSGPIVTEVDDYRCDWGADKKRQPLVLTNRLDVFSNMVNLHKSVAFFCEAIDIVSQSEAIRTLLAEHGWAEVQDVPSASKKYQITFEKGEYGDLDLLEVIFRK